jgi:hypothetical protein
MNRRYFLGAMILGSVSALGCESSGTTGTVGEPTKPGEGPAPKPSKEPPVGERPPTKTGEGRALRSAAEPPVGERPSPDER